MLIPNVTKNFNCWGLTNVIKKPNRKVQKQKHTYQGANKDKYQGFSGDSSVSSDTLSRITPHI